MSNNLVTSIQIRAGVDGLQDINRLSDAIEQAGSDVSELRQESQRLQTAWNSLSTNEQTRQLEQLTAQAQQLQRVTNARMTLGLTGDDAVRQQIQDVTRAYQTLQSSGTLTQTELARATQLHTQQLNQLEGQLQQTRPTLQDMAGEFGNLVATAGGLAYITREAMKFETAMADVKKVVDGTPEQIQTLSQEIQQMAVEMGMGADAIAQITAQGGQLGVPLEQLGEFTRMAGQMAVAFNMTAEEAGDAAAKLANVFDIPIEKVGELGDAINTLGNTTAAKEREIVDVMNRIGGTTKQFGLAKEQAAALSAAFISLGKTPETAGTAINALLTKLSTANVQSDDFQKALANIGISANQLAKDISQDPQKALENFLQTLGTLNKEQQSIVTFKLFGQEYVDDISLLVGGLNTYKKALDEVADKGSTAGAMQKEFEARMSTTSASVEQAKASIGVLTQTVGSHLLPVVSAAAKGVADLTSWITEFAKAHPMITQLGVLLASAQVAMVAYTSSVRLLGMAGITSGSQMVTGFTQGAGAVNLATVAVQRLNTAMAGTMTGVGTATTALNSMATGSRTLSTDLQGLGRHMLTLNGLFAAAAGWTIGQSIGESLYKSSEIARSLGDNLARLIAYGDALITDRTFADVNTHFETSAESSKRLADNAQKAVTALTDIANSNADFATKISQTESAIQAITTRIDELTRYGQTASAEYQQLSSELDKAKTALQVLQEAQANHKVSMDNATNAQIELANTIKITTANLETMQNTLANMEAQGQKETTAFANLAGEIDNTKSKLELLNVEANKQGIGELLKTDLDKASESFKALGLDAQEFSTGISTKTNRAMLAFVDVARLAGDNIDQLARAYSAAQSVAEDNINALALLEQKLIQVTGGNQSLANAVKETAKAQQEATTITDAQKKALDALGVSIDASNAKMSVSGQKMAQNLQVGLSAIKEQIKGADELKGAIATALDTSIASAKTVADFKAIEQAIKEVGVSGQISGEQLAKIQAGATGGASAVKQLEMAIAKSTQVINNNTQATTNNTQVKKAQAQANKEVVQSTDTMASSQEKASSGIKGFASGLAGIYNNLKNQVHALTSLGVSVEDTNRAYLNLISTVKGSIQMDAYWQEFGIASKRIQQQTKAFKENRQSAIEMTEQLKDSTVTMKDITRAQKVLQTAAETTVGGIKLMDKTTLKNLQDQIDKTKQKFADLTDSAKQTVSDLQSELAGLQGDEEKVRQIQQERKLKELQNKMAEAQGQGNQSAVQEYQKALELQEQIYQEQIRQVRESREREQASVLEEILKADTAKAQTTPISAKDIGAIWDSRIAQIKDQAKQEFAQELMDDAKRRAR